MEGIKEALSQVWAKIDALLALLESKGAKVLATAAEIRKAQRAIKGIWHDEPQKLAEAKSADREPDRGDARGDARTDPDVRVTGGAE